MNTHVVARATRRAWLAALLACAAAVLVVALPQRADAHGASTAYLDVAPSAQGTLALQWSVALRDLDAVLDLDANGDGVLRWSEVIARRDDLVRTTRDAIRLSSNGTACNTGVAAPRFTQLDSGGYAVIELQAECRTNATLQLDYRFQQKVDATHRVLLSLPGHVTPRPVAPGERIDLSIAPGDATTTGATAHTVDVRALLADGFTHILGGFDHLLFLVALLLPAVMQRQGSRWVARADLKPALVEVACIATAFTLAHSLTLGLASFHLVAVPGRVIEPLIAFTVLAAALNNLKPLVTRRVALVAFAFGLIHGFGFAEVLAPLDLPARELALALLGFNLGVEGGQLAIIACAFTLLALLRRWRGYARWIVGAGSAALALTAGVWMIERVFNLPLFALVAART